MQTQQPVKLSSVRLGASSVADLCGYGHNSIQKLWRIKTQREEREPPSAAMQWGTDNEQRAILATECELGVIWSHTGTEFKDQYRLAQTHRGASLVAYPDGVYIEANSFVEVKCPQELRDDVPLKYLIQIQTAFYLSSIFHRCLYAEWLPGECRMWWVYPNEDFQAVLLQYINRFLDFVETDETPPRWTSKANPKPEFPEVKTERV